METTNKTLELEAEKQFPLVNIENASDGVMRGNYDRLKLQQGFIAGATSTYAEKRKLEFAIEQLNKLDSVLQAKVRLLLDMCDESSDKEFYSRKISGIKLAKEEIRRDIKELEQKLSDLSN